jgi:hypothetical protein
VEISLLDVHANGNEDEGVKVNEKFDDDDTSSDGDLVVSLIRVTANGSLFEEGIALTEEGEGNFVGTFEHVTANGNTKEGIDVSESGSGDLAAYFYKVKANDNLDNGIQIKEADGGNLAVTMEKVEAKKNLDFGLSVTQKGPGEGTLELDKFQGSIETDGVDVILD